MRKIKFLANCLLSFLLILLICSDLLIILVHNKILDKEYIISYMDNIKYYDQISNEINSSFENYKYQSGLPEETLNDLYSVEIIKKDVNSVIDYIYEGTEISNSSEIVKSNLDLKINDYIEKQNIKLNDQGKENIKIYEDIIEKEYSDNINASKMIYKALRDVYESIYNMYNTVKIYAIIISLVVIISIILMNVKNLLIAMNYIGISILSSGIIIYVIMNYIDSKISLDNIVLFSKASTSLVINLSRDVSILIKDTGMLLVFCGIVSILISNILNINNKSDAK